ncbi:mitochondrial import inner membrane translocase subunit TIM44-like [Anopheles marshallii]|uniref:mitochondrial import inner membrane translocase subunit TIM44-like n=1 Tax=Anopheles marshallii TaxID=1521116 RepID=UPI00237B9919|nr:mitochondrial import inner membrane translocase subunit TIM44-like [Anopheles marshallii]
MAHNNQVEMKEEKKSFENNISPFNFLRNPFKFVSPIAGESDSDKNENLLKRDMNWILPIAQIAPTEEDRMPSSFVHFSGIVIGNGMHTDSEVLNNHYNDVRLLQKHLIKHSVTPHPNSMLLTPKVLDMMPTQFAPDGSLDAMVAIRKMEPNFNIIHFLRYCANAFIPELLGASVRGDLGMIRDRCYQRAYDAIAPPIAHALVAGYRFDSTILGIERVRLAMGRVMQQGPVLVITFQAQQIMCMRDGTGTVVAGDPQQVLRCHHVWALCRDPSEVAPESAWRLLELVTDRWIDY